LGVQGSCRAFSDTIRGQPLLSMKNSSRTDGQRPPMVGAWCKRSRIPQV
jgi:hypothetical protein